MFARKRVGFYFNEAGDLVFDKPAYSALRLTLGISRRLDGDTLAGTPEWLVPAAISKAAESNTGDSVTARLGGGTAGEQHTIKCRWQTASGDQDEAEFTLNIT